jgi:hypothetical protein
MGYGKNNGLVGIRKRAAVKIGRLTQSTEYNVLMRFKHKNGAPSEYMPMANITIFIRDKFMYNVWIGIIAILVTAFITLMLKACGIPS